MTMRIAKRFTFEAAHFIPGHPTCGKVHGHSYTVEIELTGELDKFGMLVDYDDLKRHVQPIINTLDHQGLLNDTMEYPTTENIILYIKERVEKRYPNITRIRVSETLNNYAEWGI